MVRSLLALAEMAEWYSVLSFLSYGKAKPILANKSTNLVPEERATVCISVPLNAIQVKTWWSILEKA